jgi:hypothetical protein
MIYPNRYKAEPRKRNAYKEACDMIAVYGIPKRNWNYCKHNISKREMNEIWGYAQKDMQGNSRYNLIVK